MAAVRYLRANCRKRYSGAFNRDSREFVRSHKATSILYKILSTLRKSGRIINCIVFCIDNLMTG